MFRKFPLKKSFSGQALPSHGPEDAEKLYLHVLWLEVPTECPLKIGSVAQSQVEPQARKERSR